MTTAITKTGTDYTREQIDTIKQTVAKGANDSQLALFLQVRYLLLSLELL